VEFPVIYGPKAGGAWGSGTSLIGPMTNPMTTLDDIIVGGTVTGGIAAPARLGKGTDGQVLTVDPATHHLLWATPGGGSVPVTTKGDLFGYSTAAARVPIGADTQVLTADSTQALGLKWAAGGGGGGALVLLEQHTAAASATLDFTTCISSTYDEYLISLVNVLPATNSVVLKMQFSTDGGSTYIATGYAWQHLVNYGSANSWENGSGDTAIAVGGASISNSNSGVCGSLRFYGPALSGTTWKCVMMDTTRYVGAVSSLVHDAPSQGVLSVGAVNAFRFLFSSGNIASGTIRVYGIAK
jgi:hypothetical protein